MDTFDSTVQKLLQRISSLEKRLSRMDGQEYIIPDTRLLSDNATANTILAGPTSGSAAAPTFRTLTTADLPVMPEFTATKGNTNQDVAAAYTWTLVTWTETSDPQSMFASNVWTPSAGTYLYVCSLRFDKSQTDGEVIIGLWNTTTNTEIARAASGSASAGLYTYLGITAMAEANGTDSFGIKVYWGASGSAPFTINGYTAAFAVRRMV